MSVSSRTPDYSDRNDTTSCLRAQGNHFLPEDSSHKMKFETTFELDRCSLGQMMCGGPRTKLLLLEGLSFGVRTGELLAIIATSEQEGSALQEILANRHPKWGSRLRGDIMFNGLFMPPARLEHCVAYVARNWHLWPDMSVWQWMLFTSLLQEPGGPGRDTKARAIHHNRNYSFLNPDVVLLDQPISGMDILDSFFLIDYLRQWAARGRIVVMTIHPPTYEIFTLMARGLILIWLKARSRARSKGVPTSVLTSSLSTEVLYSRVPSSDPFDAPPGNSSSYSDCEAARVDAIQRGRPSRTPTAKTQTSSSSTTTARLGVDGSSKGHEDASGDDRGVVGNGAGGDASSPNKRLLILKRVEERGAVLPDNDVDMPPKEEREVILDRLKRAGKAKWALGGDNA
ncbi:hypothetical protein MTO96_047975 [Rhipicephalus appendiculatus]